MQTAYAHGLTETEHETGTVAGGHANPVDISLSVLYGESIFLVLVLIVFLFKRKCGVVSQVALYTFICISVLFTTAGLVGATIYLNVTSPTGGPIHWHADYRVNVCGESVMLTHSHGMSDKVGMPTLHSHDDSRIHIEGTPQNLESITLGAYFHAIGGEMTSTDFAIPTDKGMVTAVTGDQCNGTPATVRIFAEKQELSGRRWSLLDDPAQYVISPFETVPPGDRIYISFDSRDSETVRTTIPPFTPIE